jgi:transcription elongation factor GreA
MERETEKQVVGNYFHQVEQEERERDMKAQENILTSDSLPKAVAQLQTLKESLINVTKYLYEAQEAGNMSENADSEDAKNEQTLLEKRILELENIVAKAKLIHCTPTDEI